MFFLQTEKKVFFFLFSGKALLGPLLQPMGNGNKQVPRLLAPEKAAQEFPSGIVLRTLLSLLGVRFDSLSGN